jgi:putrescine aminotransferase
MKDTVTVLDIDAVLKLSDIESSENHKKYGNSGLTSLLCMLGLDKKFVRARGSYIWDEQGNRYLDFLSGYGALSLGHNHPRVLEAIKKVEDFPNILQVSLNVLAGGLARNIAAITPGELQRTFFCNSGAEAVEGSLKLARAATGKAGILYAENSFHGKSFGALSVTGREKYRKPFLPLLPETGQVSFGDTAALEKCLMNRDIAAFIVEPVQGEGGIIVPPAGYLSEVRQLCTKYDTLLILDEIQTGLGRTGKMFACNHENVTPDIMCLAKTLGGGVMPIGAFVTTNSIWEKAFGGMQKCTLHSSTFGGNSRACAAGIAAIQVLIEEKLADAAMEKGKYIMEKLASIKEKHKMIKEVRGKGLLIGIEFEEATGGLLKTLSMGVVNALSKEYLASLVSGELANKHRVITAYTLNNPNVIRLEPPLNVSYEDIDYALKSLDEVLSRFHGLVGATISSAGAMISSFFKKKE